MTECEGNRGQSSELKTVLHDGKQSRSLYRVLESTRRGEGVVVGGGGLLGGTVGINGAFGRCDEGEYRCLPKYAGHRYQVRNKGGSRLWRERVMMS